MIGSQVPQGLRVKLPAGRREFQTQTERSAGRRAWRLTDPDLEEAGLAKATRRWRLERMDPEPEYCRPVRRWMVHPLLMTGCPSRRPASRTTIAECLDFAWGLHRTVGSLPADNHRTGRSNRIESAARLQRRASDKRVSDACCIPLLSSVVRLPSQRSPTMTQLF